jgi:hypothetical protein
VINSWSIKDAVQDQMIYQLPAHPLAYSYDGIAEAYIDRLHKTVLAPLRHRIYVQIHGLVRAQLFEEGDL